MGRPKKDEMNPVPTRARILSKAMELFSQKGFDAVSVRDITKALGLNPATLYIYFDNKDALLQAIFDRFEENLIIPAFKVPPVEYFQSDENFDLKSFLIKGADIFFGRVDDETRLTWRILMMSQYRFTSARDGVMAQIVQPPQAFFSALLKNVQTAGKLNGDIDTLSAGRMLAAIYFDFSFRANLAIAWTGVSETDFSDLHTDISTFVSLLV